MYEYMYMVHSKAKGSKQLGINHAPCKETTQYYGGKNIPNDNVHIL